MAWADAGGALAPAAKPTLYFIGVTTGRSSINAVFPRWAERLGLGDCALRGIDLALGDEPARYRSVVEAIRRDPLVCGGLVTSHKVAVHGAARALFDGIDPLSDALGEISSVYKRRGKLLGRSVDPWTVGDALRAFLPPDHWAGGAEVLILGAGGSGTALAWHLAAGPLEGPRPRRIQIVDRRVDRVEHLGRLRAAWNSRVPLAAHGVGTPAETDRLLGALPAGSLVVNATGLGKDGPGSPLTDAAMFPEAAFVWDFNYRGELRFLAQARAQADRRGLRVEDGWTYFLHGWLRVLADVFDRDIPAAGPLFDDLARLAAVAR